MSSWPSSKPNRVLRGLLKKGWAIKSQKGSHIQLSHPQLGDYTFAYHEGEELGPVLLKKIGKKTGLTPEDL